MKTGPFIKSKNSTTKMMNQVLISLIPIILFGFYKHGLVPFFQKETDIFGMLYPLVFVILGGTFTYIIERLWVEIILKKKGKDTTKYMGQSFSVLPGILLTLIVPLNTPIWILFFGSFATIILGKMVYGGFRRNIFNPVLIGRICVIILYASVVQRNIYEVGIINDTPILSNIMVVEAEYKTIKDFFLEMICETPIILCTIAYIYLSCRKVIKRKIPVIYIGTVFLLTWWIGHMNNLSIWYPILQICSGSLMFGATFMATDSITSPTTPIGQVLYGLGLGILTIIFRFLISFPEAVFMSILIMNIFVTILDMFGSQARGKVHLYATLFIICATIGLLVAYSIGKSYVYPITIVV